MKLKELFYKRDFQSYEWGLKPVWVMRDWWVLTSAIIIAGAAVIILVLISGL